MPSSSNHDTEKERTLMYAYLCAHVRIHHASQYHMNLHVLGAFAAILEMEESDLEYKLQGNIGQRLVQNEEDKIAGWRDGSKSALVQSAAEIVEDCARDHVGGAFGADQQLMLCELAQDMFEVARDLRTWGRLDVITIDGAA